MEMGNGHNKKIGKYNNEGMKKYVGLVKWITININQTK